MLESVTSVIALRLGEAFGAGHVRIVVFRREGDDELFPTVMPNVAAVRSAASGKMYKAYPCRR